MAAEAVRVTVERGIGTDLVEETDPFSRRDYWDGTTDVSIWMGPKHLGPPES